VSDSRDTRPPFAVAMEWTSRITTIAAEMALPGLIGYWIDQKLGTDKMSIPLFVVVGVTAGFSLGIWHLVRLANPSRRNARGQDDSEQTK
jgi:F0F1-type ATP synthase assembly protein I